MRARDLVLTITLVSACGSTTVEPPPTTQPTPLTVVAGEVDDGAMAVLEAHWMCDVSRFTFSSLAEMEAELDERLTQGGASRVQYDDFKVRSADSAELKSAIATEFEAYCLIAG